MPVKEPPKKLSKSKKDLPRYKAITQYEGSFKRAYSKEFGEGMEEFSDKVKEFIDKQE